MDQHGDRIVIGLDDSGGGRAALRFALLDAARRDATVKVVAAFQPPEYWAVTYGGMPAAPRPAIDVEEVRSSVQAAAERIVAEVRADLPAAGTPVSVVAVPGSAVAVLLDASRGADLLVIGSRGRGGFASMLLGSVSMQCVLHATCPVTVVHPDPEAAADLPPAAQHAMAT
jgi:nucleotide-binding universal stress UspA family protein